MVDKQSVGRYAPDNSKYGCLILENHVLDTTTTSNSNPKQNLGAQAPDGSIYFTLTDGSGALV